MLNSQTNRKQSKQVRDPNPSCLIQADDDEAVSWIDCPIDESFEREFCANFLSEIPPSFDESSKKVDGEKGLKFAEDFAPPPPPPPRFQEAEAAARQPQLPGKSPECSGMTVGSSHCASNQVVNEVDMSWASSCGIAGAGEAYAGRVNKGVERETLGQARTSCSGGSGSSSFWKTCSVSNDTSRQKRKNRDMEESECPSDVCLVFFFRVSLLS